MMFYLFIISIIAIATIIIIIGLVLYLIQESLIFNPESLPKHYQFELPYTFKEEFVSIEGGSISTLLVTQPKPKGCILFFPGNAFCMSYWASMYSKLLYPSGYDILFLDYPGFGKSNHKIHSEKQLTNISNTLYHKVYSTNTYKQNIIVYGVSFGSGMACKTLLHKHPPKQLILETPFYDFLSIAKFTYPFLPVKLLLKYKFKNHSAIQHSKVPVAIFHGSQDKTIPCLFAQKLQRINLATVTLHIYEGAAHRDLMHISEFIRALNACINQV